MLHRGAVSTFLLLVTVILLLPALSGHAANATDPTKPVAPGKRKIAILAFEAINDTAKQDNKGRMISEMFTTSAVNSGIFAVVERHLIEKVLEEMEFGKSEISGTVAQKIGALVGAEAVLTGSVSQLLDDLRIESRLISVADGQILLASADTAKITMGSIVEATDKSMRKMIAALDPEAAKRLQAQAGPPAPSVQPKAPLQQGQTAPAATAPGSPSPGSGLGAVVATSNNGRFKKYSSGVFVDTTTNLEWYASQNQTFTLRTAKAWVASLNVAGGGWRMPTRSELASLKADKFQMTRKTVECTQKDSKGSCFKYEFNGGTETADCYRPGVLDWAMVCGFVWSGEIRDSASAWGFGFSSGKELLHLQGPNDSNDLDRALAVRARTKPS